MPDYYLFKTALRDLARPKRLLAAAVLAALPNLLALCWRVGWLHVPFDPTVAYNTIEPGLVVGFVLVILSVVFGTGVVSQEIEQKTIVYLLTRPIPRWRILLMRYAAAAVAILLPLWFTTLLLALITFGPAGLPGSPLGRDLLILPLGALAYGGLFLLVATLLPRPLMWGLLFAFGWESWVPDLGGSFAYVSIMNYLRVLAPHPAPENESMDVTQFLASMNPVTISPALAGRVLALMIAFTLLAALVTFSLREYAPRDDAE